MTEQKKELTNKFSLLISLVALILSSLSFYFQFFYKKTSLLAYTSQILFDERASIEYILLNNGDTPILVLFIEGYEKPSKPVSFPDVVVTRENDLPDVNFPFQMNPGDTRTIKVPIQCSFKNDGPHDWHTIFVEFGLLDLKARRFIVIDELEMLCSEPYKYDDENPMLERKAMGVKRDGIPIQGNEWKPIQLISNKRNLQSSPRFQD